MCCLHCVVFPAQLLQTDPSDVLRVITSEGWWRVRSSTVEAHPAHQLAARAGARARAILGVTDSDSDRDSDQRAEQGRVEGEPRGERVTQDSGPGRESHRHLELSPATPAHVTAPHDWRGGRACWWHPPRMVACPLVACPTSGSLS